MTVRNVKFLMCAETDPQKVLMASLDWVTPDERVSPPSLPPGTYYRIQYDWDDFNTGTITNIEEPFGVRSRTCFDGDSLTVTLKTTVASGAWGPSEYVTDLAYQIRKLETLNDRQVCQVGFQRSEFARPWFIRSIRPEILFAHANQDPFEIVLTYSEGGPVSPTDDDGFIVFVAVDGKGPKDRSEHWESFQWVPGSYADYEVLISKSRGAKAIVEIMDVAALREQEMVRKDPSLVQPLTATRFNLADIDIS